MSAALLRLGDGTGTFTGAIDRRAYARELIAVGSIVKFGVQVAVVADDGDDGMLTLIRRDGQACRCPAENVRFWAGIERVPSPTPLAVGARIVHQKYGPGRVWFVEAHDTLIAHFGRPKRRRRVSLAACRSAEAS